jgi:hypothetical protein
MPKVMAFDERTLPPAPDSQSNFNFVPGDHAPETTSLRNRSAANSGLQQEYLHPAASSRSLGR